MARGNGRQRRPTRGYSVSATLGVVLGLIALPFVLRVMPFAPPMTSCPLPYRALYGHTGWVNCVAYSPDGRYLSTGSDDGTAILWVAATGAKLATLRGHTDAVDPVQFCLGGRYLVTGSLDGTARLWSVPDGECVAIMAGEGQPLDDLSVVPGAQGAAGLNTLWADGQTASWRIPSGELLDPSADYRQNMAERVATASGERYAATAGHDGQIAVCGASGDAGYVLRSHAGRIESLALHEQRRLLAASSGDNTVRVWDLTTGGLVAMLRTAATGLHDDWIERHAVAFSPDGARLATAQGYIARIYDLP